MIIYIVNDTIYELTEQFMAVLTTNDSCVEFKQESKLISILDDDCELCIVCNYKVCVHVAVKIERSRYT